MRSSSDGWLVTLGGLWVVAAGLWAAGCEASANSPSEEPLVDCVGEGRVESCFTGPDEQRGLGVCRAGTHRCEGGVWTECSGQVLSAPEVCGDGLDDDCDGAVDNGCPCTTFDSQSCFGGSPESREVGVCVSGQQQCVGASWSIDCAGQVLPSETDSCGNGLDDDCNGVVDDDCEGADAGTG